MVEELVKTENKAMKVKKKYQNLLKNYGLTKNLKKKWLN